MRDIIGQKHDILVSNVYHVAMKLSEIYYWTEA